MNFLSDNTFAVCPEIMDAIVAANEGPAESYGGDQLTQRLNELFSELFQNDVAVFPVSSGTAANALALSVLVPPYGEVLCSDVAHILGEECGAPEFYTGGARITGLTAEQGKLSAETLRARLERETSDSYVHYFKPSAVSVTQSSECGTVYRTEQVAAIGEVAREHGLALHMDGTRLSNAVAALGCSLAETTWKAGVDVLCFGATKNGAMNAEIVVLFRTELARDFSYRHKRGGHLVSKMRFMSAQLEAYVKDGLWLKNAQHANRMASLLASGLADIPGVKVLYPPEANEVFLEFSEPILKRLKADGFWFFSWKEGGPEQSRLVTSFATSEQQVETFLSAVRKYAD